MDKKQEVQRERKRIEEFTCQVFESLETDLKVEKRVLSNNLSNTELNHETLVPFI